MARRDHPPIATEARPAYRALRIFGTVMGIVGVTLAAFCMINGYPVGALLSAGTGVTFVALTWLPPTSRWILPLMAILVAGIALAAGNWWIVGIAIVTLVWFVWARGRLPSPPTAIEPAASHEVMENAAEFVAGFRTVGFEQVAAYRAEIGRRSIIVSLLIAPDSASYAGATDVVLNVTSFFPEGRRLHTRNHNATGLPPGVLINPVSGATPKELVASHEAAPKVLAQHGHLPVPLSRSDLPDVAIDTEYEAIEWLADKSRIPQPIDRSELQKRPDRDQRIAAWAGAQLDQT